MTRPLKLSGPPRTDPVSVLDDEKHDPPVNKVELFHGIKRDVDKFFCCYLPTLNNLAAKLGLPVQTFIRHLLKNSFYYDCICSCI